MNEKNITIGIVIAALLLAGAIAYTGQASNQTFIVSGEDSQNLKTITVTGENTINAKPNIVEVYFAVETKASTAQESQSTNSEIAEEVRNALKAEGIAEEEIETISYNVYPEYEWNNEKYVLTGYKTTHQMKIELQELDKAGNIADTAIQAGANRIDSIQFGLSDSLRETLQKQALKNAGMQAKQKAEQVAQGIGTKITGIKSATESSSYYPVYRDYAVAAEVKEGTVITPGEIQVTAQVQAVFLIE